MSSAGLPSCDNCCRPELANCKQSVPQTNDCSSSAPIERLRGSAKSQIPCSMPVEHRRARSTIGQCHSRRNEDTMSCGIEVGNLGKVELLLALGTRNSVLAASAQKQQALPSPPTEPSGEYNGHFPRQKKWRSSGRERRCISRRRQLPDASCPNWRSITRTIF